MAFYTNGVVPWNSLDNNTRAPLTSELEAGYPCGEADQQLFNFTAGYPIGQIYNLLLEAGITPDFSNLVQMTDAIKKIFVIDTAVTKTVYGSGADFADINAANLWLSRRRIASSGSVTFTIGSAVYTNSSPQQLSHPDGARVTLIGGTPINGGFLPPSSYVISGNSAGQRASNNTTNLATVRNRMPTELRFTGTAGLTCVNIGNIKNLHINGSSTSVADGLYVYGGATRLENIVVSGFVGRGFVTRYSILALTNVVGFGCTSNGVSIEDGTNASALGAVGGFSNGGSGILVMAASLDNISSPLGGSGNAGSGIHADRLGNIKTSGSNTSFAGYNTNGFRAVNQSFIEAIGADPTLNTIGFLAENGGYINASNSVGTSNATNGYAANNSAFIDARGGTSGTLSPAANTLGSGNAYIRQ